MHKLNTERRHNQGSASKSRRTQIQLKRAYYTGVPPTHINVPMSDQDGSVQKILHEQVERVNKPQMALSSKQLEKLAQDLRLPYGVKQLKMEMKRIRAGCT